MHLRHVKYNPNGGPDGGDGGHGGDVVLVGSRHEDSLVSLYYNPKLVAENGQPGRGQQMHGRNGRDLEVNVPCGTTVVDVATGETVFDVVGDGQRVTIARGGRGGFGNVHFKSSTNQAPTRFVPGLDGEEFDYRLELKVIADIGLVGFPNAGKSSLVAAVSEARPKVGAYPFTTLNPVIGTVIYPDGARIRVADIPGIIDGAHEGVGLGIDFLKHVARAKVLAFVIDCAGTDNRDPVGDYKALRREIRLYDPEMLKRPAILVANKAEEPGAAENIARLEKAARRRAVAISALRGDGIAALLDRFRKVVKPAPSGMAASAKRTTAGHAEVSAEKLSRATFLSL